jgi:chromosome segregation ATPase
VGTAPTPVRDAWERATEISDPLAALTGTRELFGEIASWQTTLVEDALRTSATWEEIGAALGTTRQAAWARFRSVAEQVEGLSIPNSKEVKEMSRHVKDELRGLQSKLNDFDQTWRERQADLTEQARQLERERRQERKQLQQEMRSLQASLRDEINALREVPQ